MEGASERRRANWARLRQGNPRGDRRPYVLHLANLYASPADEHGIATFAEAVAEGSQGLVRVKFVNSWASDADRHEERSLILDVARGRADLGWAGTRVFGTLGVRSLDPLQAPFLIDTYERQRQVCSTEIPAEMLERLEQLGLVGLAVLPGALRKPFGLRSPFISPNHFAGAVVRTHESTVGDAAFRALGATPVLLSAKEMRRAVSVGVDGMDLHASAVAGWGYTGHLTWNVNLWPRMLAIVANRNLFSRLGDDLQQLLRGAASRSAVQATLGMIDQERLDRESLPADIVVYESTDDDKRELRARVEPVYRDLRSDPEARGFVARLETILESAQSDPAGEPK